MAEESNKVFDLNIYTQIETIFGPHGALYAYFQMMPMTKPTDNCYIDIVYTSSEVLLTKFSFLTLNLNNIPVSSISVDTKNPDTTAWRVKLPPGLFKEGYNEISLSSTLRVTDDPCVDLYNSANWVKINISSNLHLEVIMENPDALYRFPYPYLNILSNEPVNSRILISKPFNVPSLEALFKIASDYGSKVQFKNLDIRVGSFDKSYPENKVYIGTLSELKGLVNKSLNAGEGYLLQSAEDVNNIYVTGTDNTGVKKAVDALVNPNLLAQNDVKETIVTRTYEDAERKYDLPRQGLFFLEDISIPHIKLEGIFTQRKSIIIKRPVRHGAGIESYVKVFFSHSDNLDRQQSLLSIFINGLPAGSISLGPENIKGGELVVKIPQSELNKPGWALDFVVYHYVGAVEDINCVYDYNAVCWTFIEGKSEIYLAPGAEIRPVLNDFPNLIGIEPKSLEKIYFWFPESPDEELIKVASLIAAKSGQVLKRDVNFNVIISNTLDEKIKNEASVIFAMGYMNNTGMWNTFGDKIFIKPEAAKKFTIHEKIETPNYDLSKNSMIQAFESPWNADGVIYTVTLSSPSAVTQISDALNTNEKISKFSGQVCLILPDANVVPLGFEEKKPVVDTFTSPLKRIPLRYIIAGLFLLALIVFLIYRLVKNRKKK
ncbi:MAG: cellulose biosynthesis cyclic di-GMP-binding regulatory protein BcsB [Ignavibacteria bacterium]|nr:cellulose biosynthesis cyclic di-GMP-binding regulatory protein BcsB [Ignavibacteria bacterium]